MRAMTGNRAVVIGAVVVLMAGAGQAAAGPSFAQLRGIASPGGGGMVFVNAVSPDGSRVGGTASTASGRSAAVVWDRGGVATIVAHESIPVGSVNGFSADGSVLLMNASFGAGQRPVLWRGPADAQYLSGPIGPYAAGRALSGDGRVVVGTADTVHGSEGFYWTAETGMVGLGFVGSGNSSRAFAMSADGSVIVGDSSGSEGGEAYVWTAQTGMVGLGDLEGGPLDSSAEDVSADGRYVVGHATAEFNRRRAVRWDRVTGEMRDLGASVADTVTGSANAISDDGRLVVGGMSYESGPKAFMWTETAGLVFLNDWLAENAVAGAEGWDLRWPWAASADGSVIAGTGLDPLGREAGWVLTIPEPAALLPLLVALVAAVRRR